MDSRDVLNYILWKTSNMRLISKGSKWGRPYKQIIDICILQSYVYYTQIMQAETLSSAYRLWRRNWKGKGKEYTAGALVWQVSHMGETLLSFMYSFNKLKIAQWLLAGNFMGNRRLFSSTETGVLRNFPRIAAFHCGHDKKRKEDLCKW